MHLVIFEDARWIHFAPASLSRPVFSLLSGSTTLLDKLIRDLNPTRLTLWVRPQLVPFCERHVVPNLSVPTKLNTPLDGEPCLLLNAATVSFGAAVHQNALASASVTSPGLAPADAMDNTSRWRELAPTAPIGRVANYLWDLITWNAESLIADAARLQRAADQLPTGPYHLVHPEAIHSSPGVKLSPGVVLDAANGPVILGTGVTIGANAVITGPCCIGDGSTISPLASIRAGTTIGRQCKVGGEVSNTIIMDCSNKAHDGFVGDSYVGQWVNFGAGASTSNLKNTYGPISLRIGDRVIQTGKKFLGSLVGDHSKFAIGTRLMTGSYIGYCCMVAASKLTPTFLPSFTFLTDRGPEQYASDKARETMTSVFARRSRQWEPLDDLLLEVVKEMAVSLEAL
jgi:UDP-N-acetylglucosamine diphosphorylase/glucosamine-1-phosphate N-acetyltransferase